jgi:Ca-activated chloride channel family protein
MTFASPELLLGLLLVPLALGAYLLVQRRRSRYAVRFTNVDLLSNLVPRSPGWRRHVPTALYLAAIGALAIALARPSAVVAVPREEATVMLTMDVSRSMLASDVDPDRLAAAKAAADTFVDQLPAAFRIGLVAFSTDARLVTEPTTDREAIHRAMDDLRADGGTALGDAIMVSLQATADARTAAVEPSATPAPTAAQSDEPPLGRGAAVGRRRLTSTTCRSTPPAGGGRGHAGVPSRWARDGRRVPDQQGSLRTVVPDTETLAAIAETTGGRFFEAPTAEDLAQIYESLGSKVGYTQEEQEVTQWFAAAALLLVLGGAGLAAVWFNRFP